MKNNNKLTLKALKKELDLIKASKNQDTSTTKDIKASNIKNLYMQSSMFYLWLLSWILYLSNKIPYINRITALLSLYYGRTTWWKILVYLRKTFVMFNAIIGVYVVYKTTGFGVDTFYANLIALGENYINIFVNFNKRLFNWIFDLFDYKVVPNLPSEPKSPPSWWPGSSGGPKVDNTGPISKDTFNPFLSSNEPLIETRLRDLYKSPASGTVNVTIDPSPWYKDLNSLLWIGGIISFIGLGYLGYTYISDTTIYKNLFNSGTAISPTDGSITPTVGNTAPIIENNTNSIFSFFTSNIKKLNPFYWLYSSTDTEAVYNNFIERQRSNQFDSRLYPFTPYDPYASWYTRLRLMLFGETSAELANRLHNKDISWNSIIPIPLHDIRTVAASPSIAMVGLSPNLPLPPFLENLGSMSSIPGKSHRY